MSFKAQLWIGSLILWIFEKLSIKPRFRPKFKAGDIIRKKRPKDTEDWEVWDGQEPMEILDVGKKFYKIWYLDVPKYLSVYGKQDVNGEKYVNWEIQGTDREYEKIGISQRFINKTFDKDMKDLLNQD